MKYINFNAYLKEILKNATYELGESFKCVIASAPDLPGCFTQGDNFEESRDNLIDAIELWIMVGLQKGEKLPVVNGCALLLSRNNKKGSVNKKRKLTYA